jgi:hypothetical protein
MSAVSALQIIPKDQEKDNSLGISDESARMLGALLFAVSTVLSDTLVRFEKISGGVTEQVLSRGSAADHDLIVALQDFDRLQQEFAALSEVISLCARVSSNVGGNNGDHGSFGHDAIAKVPLADVKNRLMRSFRSITTEAPAVNEEQEF